MDRLPVLNQIDHLQNAGQASGHPDNPASFDPTGHQPQGTTTKLPHAKEYGSLFSGGFLHYLHTGELSDVVVEIVIDDTTSLSSTLAALDGTASVTIGLASTSQDNIIVNNQIWSPPFPPSRTSTTGCGPCATTPGEHHLHSLLLSRHSAFFAAALGQSHFADSAARRIRLTLDSATTQAWPALLEFFYTDRVQVDDVSVLPLLALARQLLVSELDAYCTDYVSGRLCAANCLSLLRAAVRFSLQDLQQQCVALAAQSFPILHGNDLSGLPPASLLEILTHPLLQVHCELQVVEAVTRYLATTAVDAEVQRALSAQIRFAYLDNVTITQLAVPSSIVLATAGTDDGAQSGSADPVAPLNTACTANTIDSGTSVARVLVRESTRGSVDAGADALIVEAAGASHGSQEVTIRGPDAAMAENASGSINAAQGGDDMGTGGGRDSRGGSDGDAAAAAADIDGATGLISASSSTCTLPASSSRGDAAAGHQSMSYSGQRQPSDCNLHATDGGKAVVVIGRSAAVQGGGEAPCTTARPLSSLGPPAPLLPRDLTLEGALARLAAIEYFSSTPWSQASPGASPEAAHHHHHPPYTCTQPAAGPGNSGGGGRGLHPYLHPYQQVQFHYQYGTGAAAEVAGNLGAAVAAANGGRRPLAVFRVDSDGVPMAPLPPRPMLPAWLMPAALARGGNGGELNANAMANGVYYNPQMAVFGPPASPPPLQLPEDQAAAARGSSISTTEGRVQVGASTTSAGGASAAERGPAAAVGNIAAAIAAYCLPPPRLSYCCNVVHGLPGGCAWADVALEALWEHLAPYIAVQVSGCSEGNPRNVLSPDSDSFFETNDSSDPLPWIELHLPQNVQVLQLHRYTFLHGHRRVGYYRARNFRTQIAARPFSEIPPINTTAGGSAPTGAGVIFGTGIAVDGDAEPLRPSRSGSLGRGAVAASTPVIRYVDLTTRMTEQFDVGVLSGATALGPWRVLRIQATGAQEDGVHRLCVRGLRMYGIARVDLMHQVDGFVVKPQWLLNSRVDPVGSLAGGASSASAAVAGYGYGSAVAASAFSGGVPAVPPHLHPGWHQGP